MVAAECFGELGGLAIADCLGGVPNGPALAEKRRGSVHSRSAKVAPEVAVAGVCERALQLPAGDEESAGHSLDS